MRLGLNTGCSEQFAERLWGSNGANWRPFVVLDVPRDYEPRPAGTGGSHLHGVLEVGHRQPGGIADAGGVGRSHRDKACEFYNEVARVHATQRGSDEIIEVRYGVPGDECRLRAVLDPIHKLRGWVGVRTPIESDVYEHVGIKEYHSRYFLTSAA